MLFNPTPVRLGGELGAASVPSPPPGLYLPHGAILNAWPERPPKARREHHTASQKAGLAYQRRVGKRLVEEFGAQQVIPGPWFAFVDESPRRHSCQADFIVDRGDGVGAVVEVKLRWTPRAWWQLKKLYVPVILATKRWEVLQAICISRSYDPAEPPPSGPPHLCRSWDDVLSGPAFNMMVLR